jgi:hypothetical protein
MKALWKQKCPVSLNTDLGGQNCAKLKIDVHSYTDAGVEVPSNDHDVLPNRTESNGTITYVCGITNQHKSHTVYIHITEPSICETTPN